MSEPITGATEEARPKQPRRLHASIAFIGGLFGLGLGYVYVGHVRHAIAFVVGAHAFLFGAAWARWPVTPVGFYSCFVAAILLWLLEQKQPGAAQPPRKPQGPGSPASGKLEPQKLAARGQVHVESSGLTGDVNQLQVWFDHRPAPAPANS